jgi:hypothetical protein
MTSGRGMLNKRLRPATETPSDASRERFGLGLRGRARVFRRIRFHLLRAIVTANGDLLAADLDLDSTVVDIPITHWAFGCIQSLAFPF